MIDPFGDRNKYASIVAKYQSNQRLISKRKRANLPVKSLRSEQSELAKEMSRIRLLIRSNDLAKLN